MTEPRSRTVVFLHSSDELYGADRMLLEMVAAVPPHTTVVVILPTDLDHPAQPLCVELERIGIDVVHADLPILRRSYRTPRGLARLGRRIAGLRSILRRYRPDMVYCTTSATFLCAPVARTVGARVIGHVQEIWSHADRAVLGPAALSCHRLIAISNAVAEALPERLRRRTAVVVNGTPDSGPATAVRAEEPLTYLVASRWNGWKGHRTLLAAWREANEPGRLVVLGGPPPSGDVVDVPGLIREWELTDTVETVGEVSSITEYLRAADVVVMPSDRAEPFGLVAIEAFAAGRPVIASAAGGLRDVVTDGVDGWQFSPGSVAELAAILNSLTPDLVLRAGIAARRSFESRFSTERFAADWRAAVFAAGSGAS